MKAIQIQAVGGPEQLKLVDTPDPEPGPNQALVELHAAGVNFIDVYLRTGLYKADLPFVPGNEGAGVVRSIGSEVKNVGVGDRVAYAMSRGSYAQLAAVPAHYLIKLPAHVSFEQGAAALLQGMTAHYLTHSTVPLQPGQTALVHAAAGGAGALIVQMAKKRGARVFGTVGSEAKMAIAREAGCDAVIDYVEQDFEEEVKALTGGQGVNVVYDSVGATTFLKGLNVLHPRGTMALFGQSSGPVRPLDPNILNGKGSLYLTRPSLAHYILTDQELQWRAGDVLKGIDDGSLRVRIDRTYPLADAAQGSSRFGVPEDRGQADSRHLRHKSFRNSPFRDTMTLQGRLTLWSMLVMAFLVTVVSISDLIGEINRQFDNSLQQSKLILSYASSATNREIQRSRHVSATEAVSRSAALPGYLFDIAMASENLVDDIAVTDRNGVILADSYPGKIGTKFGNYPDFRNIVEHGHLAEKWLVLYPSLQRYTISADQADAATGAVVTVHVLLLPVLIHYTVDPILRHHAWIAISSVVFAVLCAFLFSTVAYRPLGKVGKMLDMVASGQYELQQVSPTSEDELGAVASKVTMLGQALKGAKGEFSDLKGNFERLLDELEDAVLIFGRDRRLIAAAGAVEAFLQRNRVELVGLPVNEVFPPGTSIGLLLGQAMQLGRPIHNRAVPVSIEINGVSQLRILLLAVEFLSGESGMLIRLRDPEATRQIGRQLQTADRLSAISRLTGGVAHEVKNPLNAILMHVELAKLKLASGDYEVQDHMEVLSSEILRLDRVVKTFLDFTRPVQLNLVDVPLSDFVQELADLAAPQAAAYQIEVTVEIGPEPVLVTVDPDLFKQAVLNLVVNAVEAMPDGGHLHFWSGVQGNMAEIRISDTGPGIPSEVRDKIYNLYFTTKEKGSGIGLSMTFRIIQLHDGAISFESEPGKGTTFSLRVPVAVVTS